MASDTILALITITMTVLGGIVSAHAPSRWSYKILYIGTFILLGSGAVIYAMKQSNEAAKSDAELQSRITELSGKSNEIETLQQANNTLQQRLLKLADVNSNLTKKAIASVTGGDTFPVVSIMLAALDNKAGLPVIITLKGSDPFTRSLSAFRRKLK